MIGSQKFYSGLNWIPQNPTGFLSQLPSFTILKVENWKLKCKKYFCSPRTLR